jgi:phosphinothricin acetyltransferase
VDVNGGEIIIRRAQPGDRRAIADIDNEAVRGTTATFDTEPHSEQDRLAWLQDHDERHPVLVAERGGRVVGWAALSNWSERLALVVTQPR